MRPTITSPLLAGTAMLAQATAVYSIDQNIVSVAVAFTTTVAIVVAVLKYIDGRVQHKVDNYAAVANVQFDLINKRLGGLNDLLVEVLHHTEQQGRNRDAKS